MKAKSFFSIFVAMALVPLLLAFVVLKFGWFTAGATAKGQFVEREITLTLSERPEKPMWSLVYQPSKLDCEKLCQEQLYGLNQTYVALGKLQKRVNAFVLNSSVQLTQYPLIKQSLSSNTDLDPHYIYVVDPLGKVIMKYPGSESREKTIKTSKDILADVKKLLNYARVG